MSNRAEQFLAFDALKGLREALKEKEKIVVEKKEISDDEAEIINDNLVKVKKYMMVEAIYYKNGEYLKVKGIVTKIDKVNKKLIIVKEEIKFDDLLGLIIENYEVSK